MLELHELPTQGVPLPAQVVQPHRRLRTGVSPLGQDADPLVKLLDLGEEFGFPGSLRSRQRPESPR